MNLIIVYYGYFRPYSGKKELMAEIAGQTLGQYEIIEQIAKGGMATVYRAYQKSVKRDVAIKLLPSNFSHEDTFLERFYREVEIIAQLQHPHILPVYDFGTHQNMPYIVMAYLSGGTLADRITAGNNMPVPEILHILKQVANALDFAHSKGIIHRDFKPGNVLLDEQGNTYLADFGLAKITEAASNITGLAVLGTPTYMAPEQAGAEELTPSIDIYALGITVYEMLAGEPPFRAATASGILMAHVTQAVPDIQTVRPDLPNDVQAVLERALSKDVAKRYTSANELVVDLERALQGGAVAGSQGNEESLKALMMTNMLGHVIFVDSQCLRILKRKQNEARAVIGKSIHQVLGTDRAIATQIMDAINQYGQVEPTMIDITDAKGHVWQVMLSADATRDDDGKFVGADITIELIIDTSKAPIDSESGYVKKPADTREEDYLQGYFKSQVEALHITLQNWAGKRVSSQLEDIINETGQRNVWPVTMENGHITVQLKRTDTDIYQALLARAISYTASIIGDKIVIRELEKVNKKTNPAVLQFAKRLELDKIYEDILG